MNLANKTEAVKYPRLWRIEKNLQLPMLFLSFVWLFVLIIELVNGNTPTLSEFGTTLWILFVFYFILRLVTAPSKPALLRKNWLFIIAILFSVLRFFPALQSFLLVRSLTVTLGMQVIWIFASADQGIRFVRRALGRRGAGYVLALTAIVLVAGAAALLHFEAESDDCGV
jgi:voltage-gated potassium channel